MSNDGRHQRWEINTGEEVREIRTGRIGRATLVRWDEVYVRFEGRDKAIRIPRIGIMPTRVERFFQEVDEDDANEREYDRWAAVQFESWDFNTRWIEHKNDYAALEREQEARAFMAGMDR